MSRGLDAKRNSPGVNTQSGTRSAPEKRGHEYSISGLYFGTFPGANGATMVHAPDPPTHDPDHRHSAWLTRFMLCDNYFTDVAGPSTPNHLMVIAAASPVIDNPTGNPVFDLPSLPAGLDAAGLSWGNYGGYAFDMIKALRGRSKLASAQFAKDAAAGKLPTVS